MMPLCTTQCVVTSFRRINLKINNLVTKQCAIVRLTDLKFIASKLFSFLF